VGDGVVAGVDAAVVEVAVVGGVPFVHGQLVAPEVPLAPDRPVEPVEPVAPVAPAVVVVVAAVVLVEPLFTFL
jgi:hypothetical protein